MQSEDDYDYKFNPNEIDISIQQISLYYLLNRLMDNKIDLFPEYQRNWNLWNKIKQSRLIESILIRIPIPSFYFNSSLGGEWQVVDGVQRLTTFFNYIINQSFSLDGLEFLPQFNGCYFKDLPRELQRRIEEYTVTINLINPRTPDEIKFSIFSRINTGGITLNNQEIRYALNQGKASMLLNELSDLSIFREATFYSVREMRMNDFEYINRFISFYMHYEDYYGNLDTFMNKALYSINNYYVDTDKLRSNFIKAMEYSIKIFGNNRFKKNANANYPINRISKALFDCTSVNLAWLSEPELKILEHNKSNVLYNYNKILQDTEFIDAISFSTNTKRKVFFRFEIIKKLLKDQII